MAGTQSNGIARVYDSLSGRNRIINGSMNIVQRASSVNAGTGNTYGGPDRFVCVNSNAVGAFTQGTGTITYNSVTRPAIVQTVGTAASSFTASQYWTGIIQFIEGYNAYDLVGQPISVSFIFNTNQTGTYSVCLTDSGQGHSNVQTFTATANTPNYYSFTFPASSILSIPASTGTGLSVSIGFISGTTYQTATLGTWLTGNFQMASTATLWSATLGNFIAVSELQVEHGNIATPFEREPISTTLAKCKRYCEVIALGGYTVYNQSTTSALFTVPFTVDKRIAPSLTTAGTATNEEGMTTITGYSIDRPQTNECQILITGSSGGAAGSSSRLITTTSFVMTFNAEY